MHSIQHPIKVVARRTGLSAHIIRIWEKRYNAVEPERTGTNRRLYSEEQIERLSLLRDIKQAGHGIGRVAKLPTEELRQLAKQSPSATNQAPRPVPAGPKAPIYIQECLAAVKALDTRAFDETLQRAGTDLGLQGVLHQVVAPLLQTIGNLWRTGDLTAAHEHFASVAIRYFLGKSAKPFGPMEDAPILVVTTPAGQVHELGALLVGAAAANAGWRVTYLGASLPAAEIAGAARQCQARAVALSLVYPEDDPKLAGELTRLRELLPTKVALLVGGRATPAYGEILEKIGAVPINDLLELDATLDGLRSPSKSVKR